MKIRASFPATIAVVALSAISLSSPVIVAADAVDDLITADYESAQWALTAVRASDAWSTATGDGVVVAVLDTGVDAKHPDLDGQLVDGSYTYLTYDEETGDFAAVTDPVVADESTDYYGHGTHVSGIIAAEKNGAGVTGLAYDAQIMPVQLNLDIWSTAEFAEILDEAIHYATDNGADVINMSLGTVAMDNWDWETDLDTISANLEYQAAEEQICDAISYAASNGVIVVSASGNSYSEGNPLNIPAYCEDGISVGSVNPNFTVPSYFSSQDGSLDLVAPGETVLSTYPTEIYGSTTDVAEFPYLEMSGTSMAAPMVAAAAALWLEDYSGSDAAGDFYTAVTESAKDLMSIEGFDPYTGYGLLDVYALVDGAAPAHTLSTVPYLRLVGAGYSYNFSNGYTVVWDAPLANVLPNDYTIEIFESGQDEAVYSETVAGTQVRTSFEAISTDYSSYLVLTANYDAASVSTPPLLYSLGGGGTPDVELDPIVGLAGTRSGSELRLRWAEYSDSDADAIVVLVSGPGLSWWNEYYVEPEDGELPSSVNLRIDGADAANSDLMVEVLAVNYSANTGSEWNSVTFYSRIATAVNGYDQHSPTAVRPSVATNAAAGCDAWDDNGFSTCSGKKVVYRVKAIYQSGAGTERSYDLGTVTGYHGYWGDISMDSIYLQPRKGLTPVRVDMTPLNSNGKSISGARTASLFLGQPF